MKPSRALEIADEQVHKLRSLPDFEWTGDQQVCDHACDCVVMALFLYSFDKSRQVPTSIEWARKALKLLDTELSPRATPCRGKATDAIRVAIDLLEAVYGLDESKASLSPTRHGP